MSLLAAAVALHR